jgi:diadenosine tetraphosphate (Ap4A) HIT family hydrolase
MTCLKIYVIVGTSFITAKRHVSELDRLLPDEDQEFIFIRNGLIRAIRGAFNPITFNISCLKNDAFAADPDNTPSSAAHVHYHVKPRYGTALKVFAGEIFRDPRPGHYLNQGEHKKLEFAQLAIIASAIRDNLSKK